eukprot:gene2949-1931_t
MQPVGVAFLCFMVDGEIEISLISGIGVWNTCRLCTFFVGHTVVGMRFDGGLLLLVTRVATVGNNVVYQIMWLRCDFRFPDRLWTCMLGNLLWLLGFYKYLIDFGCD